MAYVDEVALVDSIVEAGAPQLHVGHVYKFGPVVLPPVVLEKFVTC